MPVSPIRGALGAAACCLVAATSASAHAVLERREAQADAFYRGVVQITHGCGSSPTVSVKVTIPEGAVGARPMAKPGWTVATVRGAYAKTYPFVHGQLSEGVKEITWSGASLPADEFDEFVFSVRLSEDFRPGQTVYFPVVQTCRAGGYDWSQIPAPGQDAHALAEPAPGVRIAATSGEPMPGMAMAAATVVKAGALEIEQPWMRATPGGAKVAGGYLRVTNRGSEPDRLVGAAIPISGRGEVHEMSMDGGIMRMRPVEGGIEVKPGQSVVLKPGGYHLMFMDLASGPKEGETIHGILTFEKAGTVAVDFVVRGLGAQGPQSEREHH